VVRLELCKHKSIYRIPNPITLLDGRNCGPLDAMESPMVSLAGGEAVLYFGL
jgi:hypothetical protein